jgi:signal transduction histidine kinase
LLSLSKLIASVTPRTLFGQILSAIVAGLIVVQALGIAFTIHERERISRRLLGTHTAQRVATVAKILEAVSAIDRPRFAKDLSLRPTHIRLDLPWQQVSADQDELHDTFARALSREIATPTRFQILSVGDVTIRDYPDERLCVERFPATALAPMNPDCNHTSAGLQANVQVRLSDDTVVTIEQFFHLQHSDDSLLSFALPALFGALVALFSGLIVRQLTLPLKRLATAAKGLAENLEQPGIPETGPLEIKQATRAFNIMQKELRILLETRAHALAGVSHDLRLPITRMRLRLERLTQADLHQAIDHDLAEMEQMIGNTMEFLRAGHSAEASVKVDLDALLNAVIDDMETLGARIDLTGTVSKPIRAQPQALRRCLSNLLENARRYGSGVTDVSVQEYADQVSIRIADRGPGIPEAERERVFEPYVRLETSRAKHSGGTGLGLAIARAIARQHGGDVSIESREGGGLVVVLTIASSRAEQVKRTGSRYMDLQ